MKFVRIIFKNIIKKLEVKDLFMDAYSHLTLPNKNRSDNITHILEIIIKDNTNLFVSNTNDYSGLDINSSNGDGSAALALCEIIQNKFHELSKGQIIYVAKGFISIILNKKLIEREVKAINDAYILWDFYNISNFTYYNEVKEIYDEFLNSFCADSAYKIEIMQIIMLSLYLISGRTIVLYQDFKNIMEIINDKYCISDSEKTRIKEIQNIIKENAILLKNIRYPKINFNSIKVIQKSFFCYYNFK